MPAPLIVLTGPPGAGKTTVAHLIADKFDKSAVVSGDHFFNFLHSGKIPPHLTESHQQNQAVTEVIVNAAAGYVDGGWTVVLEGIFGPWFLPIAQASTIGIDLHYLVLDAPLDLCVERFSHREPTASTAVVNKMHAEFAAANIENRYLINASQEPAAIAAQAHDRFESRTALIHPSKRQFVAHYPQESKR